MTPDSTDGRLASATSDTLERLLRGVPFFRTLDRVDIARLIGALEQVDLPAGALVMSEGAAADGLYLLERGRIAVSVSAAGGEQSLGELEAPAHLGELGILLGRRTATARSLTEVRLWKLPRERFDPLARERPALALAVATSAVELLERNRRELVGAPVVTPSERPSIPIGVPQRTRPLAWRLVGFGLAAGVPLLLWPLPPPGGLSPEGWHVGLIVLGAAIAWLFEPLPDFVTALLMVAAWGIAGLAPLSLAFAGFASSSWLVSLGAFALAVAMARSGLLFRTALLLLKTFPATHVGQVLAVLIGGVIITPLVPLALARVAAVAPLTRELAQALGYPPRSRGSAALGFAGLIGHGLFSSVFLTGLVMNFFVLDLLPGPDRARFDWPTWLASAAPAGAVLLVGAAAVLLVVFRTELSPKVTAEVLRRQERVLGPLSRRERITIVAVAVLLVGLLVQPLVRIDIAWLAIGALAVVMAGGGLDREQFRGAVDWGFLTLFGVLLGTGGVLRSVGVDTWIAAALAPLARTVGDPGALVVLLGVFVIGCRLVLPWIPATLLLSLALVPAAPQVGLSPWVVGFTVLLAASTWLHPSQSDFYRLMRDATGEELFTDRQGLIAGAAMTGVAVVALAVSVPYWRAIGILAP
jgi:anion transporter